MPTKAIGRGMIIKIRLRNRDIKSSGFLLRETPLTYGLSAPC